MIVEKWRGIYSAGTLQYSSHTLPNLGRALHGQTYLCHQASKATERVYFFKQNHCSHSLALFFYKQKHRFRGVPTNLQCASSLRPNPALHYYTFLRFIHLSGLTDKVFLRFIYLSGSTGKALCRELVTRADCSQDGTKRIKGLHQTTWECSLSCKRDGGRRDLEKSIQRQPFKSDARESGRGHRRAAPDGQDLLLCAGSSARDQ